MISGVLKDPYVETRGTEVPTNADLITMETYVNEWMNLFP